jgi:Arc/MetJ family transcription regulator
MRTNVEIDDKLMNAAMKASKAKTKREAIERGLESLVAQEGQQEIRKLRGKVQWQGDLDLWRRD